MAGAGPSTTIIESRLMVIVISVTSMAVDESQF